MRHAVIRLVATIRGSFMLRSVAQTIAAAIAGASVALLVAWLDTALGIALPFHSDNARSLVSALVAAIVTLAVFSLWMRSVVVGLVSSQVSPRIVASYLDDGFQWKLLVGMAGAIALVATILLTLPTGASSSPGLSVSVGILAVLIGLVTVLAALRDAVQRMSLPELVASLADQARAALQNDDAPDDPWPDAPDVEGGSRVTATGTGWVRSIATSALLDELPAGARVGLRVDTGVFVDEGDLLATCNHEMDDEVVTAVRDSIVLAASRSPEEDLGFALQQLRDVGQGAMSGGGGDTSTAHETLLHLRSILNRLVDRGVRTGNAQDAEGRMVLAFGRWGVRDHLRAVLEPLAHAVSDPVETRYLAMVFRDLGRHASDVGDDESRALLLEELPGVVGDGSSGGGDEPSFRGLRRPDGHAVPTDGN